MRRLLLSLVVVFAAILVLPPDVHAQAAIAGVVKDGTGAALPGVTVEASSPALIERVRSAVTDGAGQYRIIDLSPGTYDVTFTITGFKPIRRAGIVLEGNFTAPVNIELEVGNVNETVTVSGESPVVDVVSNRATVVVNRDMMDAIPTGDAQPAGARLPDSRHHGDAGRIRPDQHDHLRLAGRRSGRDGGRHAAQPARRAGAVQRHLPERRHGPGDFVRHRRAERRSRAGRLAREHDSARGRQPVLRHLLHPGRQRAAGERQPLRRGQGVHPGAARPRLHLRDQPVVRRTDQARQGSGSISPTSCRTPRATRRCPTAARARSRTGRTTATSRASRGRRRRATSSASTSTSR